MWHSITSILKADLQYWYSITRGICLFMRVDVKGVLEKCESWISNGIAFKLFTIDSLLAALEDGLLWLTQSEISITIWSANTVSANLLCALTMVCKVLPMECEHGRCEPAVCTYYGSHLLWSAKNSRCTYYGLHLLYIPTVRELQEVYLTHTKCMEPYQVWGSHGKCTRAIGSAWTLPCMREPQEVYLIHRKCLEAYQVRGSHQTYYWLILSARESLNRWWSHMYRKCTGNLIWTISSAHACCREAPYHMHISNASCIPEGLPSFYPWWSILKT